MKIKKSDLKWEYVSSGEAKVSIDRDFYWVDKFGGTVKWNEDSLKFDYVVTYKVYSEDANTRTVGRRHSGRDAFIVAQLELQQTANRWLGHFDDVLTLVADFNEMNGKGADVYADF